MKFQNPLLVYFYGTFIECGKAIWQYKIPTLLAALLFAQAIIQQSEEMGGVALGAFVMWMMFIFAVSQQSLEITQYEKSPRTAQMD